MPEVTMRASEATPLRRVVAASMVGTTIEWYDFFLYNSAAALVFNRLFFRNSIRCGNFARLRHLCARLRARPLGGIVFGHYGDRSGASGCSCSASC